MFSVLALPRYVATLGQFKTSSAKTESRLQEEFSFFSLFNLLYPFWFQMFYVLIFLFVVSICFLFSHVVPQLIFYVRVLFIYSFKFYVNIGF